LREFLADRAGAEATSDRTMATALVKVHAFAGVWSAVNDAAAAAIMRGKIYENASAMFVQTVAEHAHPDALEGLADTYTGHPTDSHPPLGARLASLRVELSSVSSAALNVALQKSAADLFPDYEAQEKSLSQAYQHLLARGLGIDPKDPSTLNSPRRVGQWATSPTDPEYLICAECGSEQWKGYTRCEKCGVALG
jgi:hypothetical protein